MKKIVLFLLLITTVYSMDLLDQLQMIKLTNPPLEKQEIYSVKNPFKTVVPSTPVQTPIIRNNLTAQPLKLFAILNNKANIGGTWVARGDTVQGFKVSKVMRTRVILRSDEETKTLTIKPKKEKGSSLFTIKAFK
jgi:hypothetical protein